MKTLTKWILLTLQIGSLCTASPSDAGGLPHRTFEGSAGYGGMIPSGRLLHEIFVSKAGEYGVYVYRGDSAGWLVLSGDISTVNLLLNEQIKEQTGAVEFLNKYMARLMLAALAPNKMSVIDELFARRWGGAMPKGYEAYVASNKPVMEGNNWTLVVNVVTRTGGVQQWRFSGEIMPLRVKSYSVEVKEKDGTYPVFQWLG